MNITVPPELDGSEILDIVRKLRVSRAELTRMKSRPDGILLNGSHATVRAVVREGDLLTLSREDRACDANTSIVPVMLPVGTVYEDELVTAYCKPAGMPTHPGHGHPDDTLANHAAYVAESRGEPFVFRPVNRLDRDTSGIVIVAKSKSAACRMSRLFGSGSVKKEYFCLLDGILPDEGPFTVRKNIKRKLPSVIERTVCGDGEGQYAETEFVPVMSSGGVCCCRVHPKTGRTHQIRVHAAYAGAPVLGDTLYGRESELIGRQALHCERISYDLPDENGGAPRHVEIYAPVPEDMAEAQRKLGLTDG